MGNVLHVFTGGGLSGDMLLAAFIDLGLPVSVLNERLMALNLPAFSLDTTGVKKSGLRALQLKLDLPDEHDHRHLSTIQKMLENSDLPARVKEQSLAVFETIGRAEAAVHGIELEKVHFHEVGALDSIVDVVGFCIACDYFNVSHIFCEPFVFGNGYVKCDHGLMPVPVPAVLEMTRNLPSRRNAHIEGEFVTPTGAGLMATLASFESPLSTQRPGARIGYGTGRRDFKVPNVLRLLLHEEQAAEATESETTELLSETLVQIECNLDDGTPQVSAFVIDELLKRKLALDAWVEPAQMKKGRPAIVFKALVEKESARSAAVFILRETSTIGLRMYDVERLSLPRRFEQVTYKGHTIAIKVSGSAKMQQVQPEYEDCRQAALELDVPLKDVIDAARRLWHDAQS